MDIFRCTLWKLPPDFTCGHVALSRYISMAISSGAAVFWKRLSISALLPSTSSSGSSAYLASLCSACRKTLNSGFSPRQLGDYKSRETPQRCRGPYGRYWKLSCFIGMMYGNPGTPVKRPSRSEINLLIFVATLALHSIPCHNPRE